MRRASPFIIPALLIADGAQAARVNALYLSFFHAQKSDGIRPPLMMGRGFGLLAYSVRLIHQSEPQRIGVGTVVVVGVAIGIAVPGVVRVVQVGRAQPPIHGVSGPYPNTSRLPPCCTL